MTFINMFRSDMELGGMYRPKIFFSIGLILPSGLHLKKNIYLELNSSPT